MKTLLITLFVLASFTNLKVKQEVQSMNATFEKYEDGTYFFTDKEGDSVEFRNIEESASNKYDLTKDTYVGKIFKVTYTIEIETDEDGEDDEESKEETVYTIVDLELE